MKHLFKTSLLSMLCYAGILTFLIACGGGTKNNNTENSGDSSKTSTTTNDTNKNNETAGSDESSSSSDESSSKDESKPKLSTNVEDYYNIWVENVMKDVEKNTGSRPPSKPKITKKDVANGFLRVSMNEIGVTGYNTMTLWAAKNGKTTFGVLSYGCGPLCSPGDIIFYEMEDGKLKNVTEKVFPLEKQRQLAKKAYDKQQALGDEEFNRPGNGYWVTLPQIGTTINMGLMKLDPKSDGEKRVNATPIAELQYNVEDNTFKLVEK